MYAYDLASGERVAAREFELDELNRAPRGVWSDGETLWVSDSGQERLFAYDLATGERVEERDIVLTRRNRDARGIWSDGVVIWCSTATRRSSPTTSRRAHSSPSTRSRMRTAAARHLVRRLTVWVSNHDPKRLFAYRLPALPEGEPPRSRQPSSA